MSFDFAIVGAGIAGASLAAELAPHARVLLLEAEDMPGYHATGRSAAFWSETYGGPLVQPLTTASHRFLADGGFLQPRGELHIADAEGEAALGAFAAGFEGSRVPLERFDRPAMEAMVPGLSPGWDRAIYGPSCADIDVAGLHQAYLRAARQAGAELRCGARVGALKRQRGGWSIDAGGERWAAGVLIDAAGAWADEVAAIAGIAPLGVAPYRRTMLQLRTDPAPPADLPLVMDALGRFYFKGEAGGKLWLSPHDETAAEAGDVAPAERDIAIAIAGLESAVDWRVEAVERKWAGLRSFAPDRLPVYGFDPRIEGFFWCAGQGGFGIQTAPAAAELCRALLLGEQAGPSGIDAAAFRSERLIA